MEKQTFTDNMTERRYELCFVRNGNITTTKSENTVRLVPLANYIIYVDTPTATAIVSKDATDNKALRIVDGLTA